ncbi:30S ribosomal protein S3 [Candidatus Dojkabacteria bacterium]|jgi:small subunit ribosomal protein S3|uniref:Small ribosomal subunit protein uS3 n=1 Tax=Candidatus Dojkabacteria bacterium TaxID=2099670 RepID=A0A847ETS9_9BACT|nr:30S ribosomal protein S3 [Candidatus Dojkabacteria bacterium]
MGRKVNANAIRMGINKTWNSVWYSSKAEYAKLLAQDLKIKEEVTQKMKDAGIDTIGINRTASKIEIEVFVARPGVAIGRGGEGIDLLQKDLRRWTKKDVEVKIREVKKADISARIIARSIADGIERRQPSKLLVASAKEKAMMAGAKGIRIWVSGRINNASQARTVKANAGSVPAQTLRADIDYALEVAQTMDAGLMGVKVWVYKGEKNNIDDTE